MVMEQLIEMGATDVVPGLKARLSSPVQGVDDVRVPTTPETTTPETTTIPMSRRRSRSPAHR